MQGKSEAPSRGFFVAVRTQLKTKNTTQRKTDVKVSEEFPSKYLKASDLNGTQPTLKIDSVTKEEVGKEGQRKMVIYFAGKQKGLVLNKTNSNTLAYKYGDDTDDWTGKDVQLYSEPVYLQGKTTDGLRVRPMVPMKQELNDEIPF